MNPLILFSRMALVAVFALCPTALIASSSPRIEVEISADKVDIHLDEEIKICAALRNIDQLRMVSVFGHLGWGSAFGLRLEVSDPSGNTIQLKHLDHHRISPSNLEKDEYYLHLQPGHSIGICRQDKASDLFPDNGSYRLVVAYRSPVPSQFKRSENFISLEDGWIASESILVTVSP